MSGLPLIQTRIRAPSPRADLVSRDNLIARLDRGADRRLTLVSAPAGYGKSTLLAQWAAATVRRSAWLSLDPGIGRLEMLLEYLSATIRSAAPEAGTGIWELAREGDLSDLDTVTAVLVDDLQRLESPLLLVIDDYHVVGDPAVHELFDGLVRLAPSAFHLAIGTRQDPPFPLPSLLAAGELTEIRARDIRFHEGETGAFLSSVLQTEVEPDVVAALEEETEGWPAGVRLAALSLRNHGDLDRVIGGLRRSPRAISEYLVAEVLDRLPDAIRKCVFAISVLDRFCAPLCEAVCDEVPDGADLVAELERINLFLNELDDEHQWFRFHHLFRRHLQTRLDPDLQATLHLRAAEWFEEMEHHEEAIDHFLEAGLPERAGAIVVARRHELTGREQWNVLEDWIGRLPRELVQGDPELLVARAQTLENRNHLGEMLDALDTLDEGVPVDPAVRAEADTLRAAHDIFLLDPAAAVERVSRARPLLGPDHLSLRGFAAAVCAFGRQMTGDATRAVEEVMEALADRRFHGTTLHARLLISLCFVHWMEADLTGLLRTARELLELSRKQDLRQARSFGRYFLGIAHYERDELDEAERHLVAEGGSKVRLNTLNFAHASYALALLHQARGREELARETAKGVTAHAIRKGNSFLVPAARGFEAELAIRQGRTSEALPWARSFEVPALRMFYRFQVPELTRVKCLLATDEGSARSALAEVEAEVEATHNRRFRIDTLILRTGLHLRDGDPGAAARTLREALEIGRAGRFVRCFADAGAGLLDLLAALDLDGEGASHAQAILAAAGRAPTPGGTRPVDPGPLTFREADVLELLGERLSNKEIASRLFISPHTVKRHTVSIYQKLHVKGRREAVVRAGELGLFHPD